MHNLKYFGICAVFVLSTNAFAEPLVTITCDKPEGFSIAYEPTKPSVKGPTKDGYRGKPTFVIDANKKNMASPSEARTHLALQKDGPLRRSVRRIGNVMAVPISADCITNTGGYDFRKGQVRSDSVITMQIILFVMHDTAKPDNRN